MNKILTHPDERLRQICEPVGLFDASLASLFASLDQTMRAGPGGVGIAAPQMGLLKRMIVVDCRESRRPCKNNGLLYMVNPKVELSEGEGLGREGCLSVPDWVGMVPRARQVCVSYQDLSGQHQQIEASGFEARVIQHEIDHLNGVLFIDRVVSTQGLVRRLTD
jgi:peptide deformylase